MNSNREDYIKIIYELQEFSPLVHNKMIAAKLNVSPASVSEMITKLQKADLITTSEDTSIHLSESGEALGQQLLRKHRLWETFLVEKLGYPWDAIHDDAELLEHVTSERLESALNHFLNQPSFCPHGSPIYGNGSGERTLVLLSDLPLNQMASFERVQDDHDLLVYLSSLDFKVTDRFTIIEKEPYEGSLKLERQEGSVFSLSYKAASQLYGSVLSE